LVLVNGCGLLAVLMWGNCGAVGEIETQGWQIIERDGRLSLEGRIGEGGE